jgi:hypothetical protein
MRVKGMLGLNFPRARMSNHPDPMYHIERAKIVPAHRAIENRARLCVRCDKLHSSHVRRTNNSAPLLDTAFSRLL